MGYRRWQAWIRPSKKNEGGYVVGSGGGGGGSRVLEENL